MKRGVQLCMPLLFLRLSCLSLIMPARSLARIWGKKLLFVFVVYRPVFLRCFIRCFCDWRFLCALFNEVLSKHDYYDSNHKFIVLSDRSNIEQIVKRGGQLCMPLLFLRLFASLSCILCYEMGRNSILSLFLLS